MLASVSLIPDQRYEENGDANYFIPVELGCNLVWRGTEGDRWRGPVDVYGSCSQSDRPLARESCRACSLGGEMYLMT